MVEGGADSVRKPPALPVRLDQALPFRRATSITWFVGLAAAASTAGRTASVRHRAVDVPGNERVSVSARWSVGACRRCRIRKDSSSDASGSQVQVRQAPSGGLHQATGFAGGI